MILAFTMVCAGMLCEGRIAAQRADHPAPTSPPPMGWSSWNSFSNTVDSRIVMEQARAMISSGMHKTGYQYINIDEGWWLGQRDAQGNFVIDEKAWPALQAGERAGDMANIVRFIHGLGLKAGIYTDAGESGCSMYPDLGPKYFHTGSEGHYEEDFLQFAKWGFDYVKVDWCGGDKENLDPAVQYAEIARAIDRAAAITGHRLYFSLCEWGKNSPWTWAPNVGGSPADIWRTSGDIVDPIVAGHEHADRKASFTKMLANFDQGIHPEAEHTGYYNDPDMMVLGMPGFSDEQNRVHMALWAISGAPLLVGADLTKLSPATLATLTNRSVLAIDQDASGLQGIKVAEPVQGLQVWSKALAGRGKRAVVLLNRTASAQPLSVHWSELGLSDAEVHVTDVWTGQQLQASGDGYTATVPPGDAAMILVDGTEGPTMRYDPSPLEEPAWQAKQQDVARFAEVQSRSRIARILITYSNPDPADRFAELRVNGQVATRIAFPSTGSGDTAGTVWIQAMLDRSGAHNVLTFSGIGHPGPTITSITVQ
jgi:hypothetical protein